MKLNEVKLATKLAQQAKVTLNLVGPSGCGKTSIFGQIYKDLGFDNYLILRPALMADAGDLIGLPNFSVVEHNGVEYENTKFMTPDFLPKEGDKTLIVLDEINRVQKDLVNPIFGMIEAEGPTVGQYKLPSTCQVVATCNPATDDYNGVLDIKDKAWSSRLCTVLVNPSQDTWNEYGKATGRVSSLTMDFFNKNPKFFGNGEAYDLDEMFGLNILNNNRSKEKISKLEYFANEVGTPEHILFEMIRGIGGNEFSQAFMNFRKDYSNIVTFKDVIKTKKNAESFDYSQMSNIAKVLDDAKTYVLTDKALTNKNHSKNFNYFLKNIPTDTMFAFMEGLISSFGTFGRAEDETEQAKALAKKDEEYASLVFNNLLDEELKATVLEAKALKDKKQEELTEE